MPIMLSNCCSLAAGALVSKNLINTSNKLFRSASNTIKKADFVYLREQEILPHFKLVNTISIFEENQSSKVHPCKIY